MEKEIGAYHNYLCEKIYQKRNNNLDTSKELIIKRKDFKRMLGWFNIPYYIQGKIIREMKSMGLIKIQDKQNVILVKPRKKDSGWFE